MFGKNGNVLMKICILFLRLIIYFVAHNFVFQLCVLFLQIRLICLFVESTVR